jgi:hypothetical protein
MAPFDQHPHHVRKSIALVCTAGVAVILVIVMIVIYTHDTDKEGSGSGNQISNFYTTIVESAQSYFTSK